LLILSVFVALGIQHAMCVRQIAICGLAGCTIFFYITSLMIRFSKNLIEHKMCVLIFYTVFVCNISHFKKKWATRDQTHWLVFM